MKSLISSGLIFLAVGLIAPQTSRAQGTTYLSNLGLASAGAVAVASDSWLAAQFAPGTNVGGYVLNYVQVPLANASGSPAAFTAMLYTAAGIAGIFPGSRLGTLSGSLDPVTAGTYTYTAPLNLTLSSDTVYFIVLTSGTPVANGAYEWSVTSTPSSGYNSYHWAGGIDSWVSSDGLHWKSIPGDYAQFAINATPVPEPAASALLALGGLCFLWLRGKANGVE